ncbi:CRISPR-associated endonuclease Cas2 [uncultured Fretibacterium sp.]|uniref:CRISPR-associated endonuclease Cas2 n=1 Tax=uncultured Fretibacterium sp. TaxID=1678694 RepID=UPI00260ABCE4|nr:CRISPR-associated endonuclease Cas2 [uncultured Fretibacterium sp.]
MPGILHVLAYDIANDRRRRQIVKRMEGIGRRVQESVFETFMTSGQIRRAVLELQTQLMLTAGDSLRVYRVCSSCAAHRLQIGGVRVEWDGDIVL